VLGICDPATLHWACQGRKPARSVARSGPSGAGLLIGLLVSQVASRMSSYCASIWPTHRCGTGTLVNKSHIDRPVIFITGYGNIPVSVRQ
jgi:hypothetical protein